MHLKAGAFFLTLAALFCASSAAAQQLDDPQFVLNARTCDVVITVEWNRHDTTFSEQDDLDVVGAAVSNSALYQYYKQASASQADLIFKVVDDEFSNSVTLEVLNPETNAKVYSESRSRVALDNDVSRLIEHFLSTLRDAQPRSDYSSIAPQPTEPRSDSSPTQNSLPPNWKDNYDKSIAATKRSSDDGSTTLQPTGPVRHEDGPSYIWVARYGREDRAQDVSRKIQGLGLTAVVIPRPVENGKRVFEVFSGPFPSARVPSVIDWLRTQGFADVHEVKLPSVRPTP